MRTAKPIYVEIRIGAPFDALWRHTRDPHLHERWDLRFTKIHYLPRPTDDEPQRFSYQTRIGLGIRVEGTGESVGIHDADGQSSSALRFASNDPKSLIEEGSGYWKYIETRGGICFLTLYDYKPRYGAVGALVDRFLFRPLIGWATAWSFDRLRLWLERGVDPGLSALRSLGHAICRVTLALIFLYQGIVPKLVLQHEDELAMLRTSGLFDGREEAMLLAFGLGEVAFAVLLIALWRWRSLYIVTIVLLLALGLGALMTMPSIYVAPFNPLTLSVGMISLATLGWVCCRDLPSARRCLRRKPKEPI
ncbi:MAG: DoxX-like family protein [Phycisphaeraceae bacterium]